MSHANTTAKRAWWNNLDGRLRALALAVAMPVFALGLCVTSAHAETITFPQVVRYILGPNDGQSGDPMCRAGSPGGNYQLSGSAYAQGGPNAGYWFCVYSPISCPDAWDSGGSSGTSLICNRSTRISATRTCGADGCDKLGGPISPATGNKSLRITDYRGSGASNALVFERFYNSETKIQQGGYLGKRWRHTYDRMIFGPDTLIDQPVLAIRPDGRNEIFRLSAGVYRSDEDVEARIEFLTDGAGNFAGWRYINERADEIETYNKSSQLVSIADRAGTLLTLTYSTDTDLGPGVPMRALLIRVTDRYGRQVNLRYSFVTTAPTEFRLDTLIDPAGKTYALGYDAARNLSTVTYPDSTIETYHYENASFPFAITGITDRNGDRHSTYTYQTDGRAASTELASGANRYSFTYATDQTTFTSPLGASRTYNFTSIFNVGRIASVSGSPFPERVPAAQSFDANGNPSSRTDWNGNKTCLKFDAQGRELARGEGLTGACPADVAAWTPAGATAERKITTQWDATFRLPIKICEPKRSTTLAYDTKGNLTTRTEQATNDAQGAQGCSATPVGTARTWTNTYTYGTTNPAAATQIVANGPRTDVTDMTTYVYQESNGDLTSITNALGHQSTLGNYDAHGHPRQITDSNGLVTTLVWDDRQRLTSRTVGSQLTTYTYDNVGQVTRITLPDASYLNYEYDDAHRLTEVRDNLGNKTTYTLDLAGNRTLEETRDPLGTLKAKRSREYSTLNRLFKDIGGTSPTTQITQYGYDNQGNLTSIDGPLTGTPNDLSTLTYDALNRLKDLTDPLSGITRYGYDGLDQTASVQDPRNNTTSYTTSGLGDQTQEVSPDRGTTNRIFNAAGNLTSSTDARSKTTAYTYDALNRLTQATFQGAAPITYAWDQGTGQKGRLTTITFPNGNTTYTYDPHGRVTQKRDTHSTGRVFTVNYAWNATTGRLTSITYPGGKVLTYGYDTAGRITSLTVGSGIIANNITYFPFGAPSGWTWGNSQVVTRSFDLDGRLTAFPLTPTDSRAVTYDDASRITQIKHPTNPTPIQTIGYDKLGRVTSWTDASSTRNYDYDANGNRTTLTIGGNNYTYTTPSTSNRLGSTSGPPPAKTFTYDAAGNIVSGMAPGTVLSYNDAGRLFWTYIFSGGFVYNIFYGHDGLGQRVKKTGSASVVPTGTSYFVYDEQGRLLGEYNSSGNVQQEYVWLGAMPIAVLRGTTGSPTIYYVYADQIDRPWIITNTANQIHWRWDTSPFGELPADDNPSGLGAFGFYLRFPGQYRDAETGLHHNYFRDYDPQTGRFVQSDPIGLAGGINPYLYGRANPLRFIDPRGLEYEPADPGAPAPWLFGIYVHNAFSAYAEGLGLAANRQHGVGTGRPDAFDPSAGFVWELKPRSYQTGYKYAAASAQVGGYCGPAPSGALYRPGHANQILRGQPNVNLTVNYFGTNYDVTIFPDPIGPQTGLLFYDYSPASGGGGRSTVQDPFGSRSPVIGPLPPLGPGMLPIP